MTTLQQILQDVGGWIDQDTTLPTGTDLTTRVNLINQALKEWGTYYQWKSLNVVNYTPTFVLSATSIGLPVNFDKLNSMPVDFSLSAANTYVQINPALKYQKLASDKYCYIVGDESTGRALVINPALTSGVSLMFDYQSQPSAMATLQDVCVCNIPEYITKRTIALILESRSDPRFPTLKADADRLLQNMVQEDDAASGAENNKMPDLLSLSNFRIGRDG